MNCIKKVLFVVPSFKMGGTIISLSGFLSLLNEENIQVDVMPLVPIGNYSSLLTNCNLVQPSVWMAFVGSGLRYTALWFHKLLFLIRRVFLLLFHKDLLPHYIRIGSKLKKVRKYDAVVCYSESIAKYVCYFNTTNKFVWIHCDYARIKSNNDFNVYSSFKNIVCVSNYGKKSFDNCWPSLSNKTITIHNVIDVERIKKKAQDVNSIDSRFKPSEYTIISVGRLDDIKQFDLIPFIISEIKKKTDRSFSWYIIGEGEERKHIESEIKRFNLSNILVLLGEQANIFPYLASSNLLVNTSKSEAYSLVNNEARALGIPVVTNNFECAKETIVDGVDGSIVGVEDMPLTIAHYIDGLIDNHSRGISNEKSMETFYKLIFAS